MKAKEKCKICSLEEKIPKAYEAINNAIIDIESGESKESMASVIRMVNKEYGLKLTPMNASRHKSHYLTQVIEIKPEELKKSGAKQSRQDKRTTETASHAPIPEIIKEVDPKYLPFLEKFRENGYRQKEKSWLDAGFGNKKEVFNVLKKPEIQAAIYEMKAADFIAMRYTVNQVLAGLMEVAYFPEHWADACDENGELKTNIQEWPEGLRNVLCGVEVTENILKSKESEEGIVLNRKYKYKFPDPLKARAELRKHGMEIKQFENGQDKSQIYQEIIEKLLSHQINPLVAGLEFDKHNIEIPPALKIAMQKSDPSALDKPLLIDTEDMSQYSDEELERLASGELS